MTRSRLPIVVVLLAALALAAAVSCGRPADETARVARVENGLRSPVVIKGDPAWNILERMAITGCRA